MPQALSGPPWLVPEYRIIAQLPANPDPANGSPKVYFMAPSMAKLPGGSGSSAGVLVAVMSKGSRDDSLGNKGLESLVVCNSRDGGVTWNHLCELPYDSCEPVLYAHGNRLYMFITPNRPEYEKRTNFPREQNGRIWVSYSDDAGATWSKPVLVLKGKPHYTSGGETALVEHGGKLYWTVSERYQTLAAVCCDLGKGILNPDAWRISDLMEMPIPRELVHGTFKDGSTMRCLEGNVVPVGGRLLVLARAVINRYGTANMAALFEIIDEGEGSPLRLEFLQLYPIPGGQCKFYIQYDAPSKLYWMASNLASNSQNLIGVRPSDMGAGVGQTRQGFSPREDRRLLWLSYSLDALNWVPAGWIAKADGWAQSFMYPVVVIDGEDLLVISRTARESGNYHDTDLATFHRVRDFRKLAVPLLPTR